MRLQFAAEYGDGGAPGVFPLIEGGADVAVTPQNVELFVEMYLEYKMSRLIMPQAEAFREGLVDVLGETALLEIFDAPELQCLLGAAAQLQTASLAAASPATHEGTQLASLLVG